MDSKTCTLCGETKTLSEFGRHRITPDGLAHWCKKCNCERQKKYKKTPSGIYTILKAQTKFWGKPPEMLTREEFHVWYEKEPKFCVYCGIKEEDLSKIKDTVNNRVFRLTIDRKDSNQGYIIENIVLSCRRCNYIKCDIFTAEEMFEIGRKYVAPKWARMLGH